MIKTNRIFSLISGDIDFKKYKLAKKCKFLEIELTDNQYLYIPKGWFHLVKTEPNTININYTFNINNISNYDNNLINNFIKKIPYKNIHNQFNITYEQFNKQYINDLKFRFYVNDKPNFSSAIKPYSKKNIKIYHSNINDLKNNINDFHNKYIYKFRNDADYDNLNLLQNIPNFNNIKNNCDVTNITYSSGLWISSEKQVITDLHFDCDDNIIYVITGKKNILLCPQNNFLYTSFFNRG